MQCSVLTQCVLVFEGPIPQPMEEVKDGDAVEEDFEYDEEFEVNLKCQYYELILSGLL